MPETPPSDTANDRLLLTMPPRPTLADFAAVMLATSAMYPDMTMESIVNVADGSFEMRIPDGAAFDDDWLFRLASSDLDVVERIRAGQPS